MWSLSIEEQFYLIWPVVLVVFFALFRGRRRIVAATVVLATASFALMWWLAATGADHTRIYEGTDTRAGGLLLGAALAIALAFRRHHGSAATPGRISALVLGLIGLGGIVALSTLTTQRGIFLYQGGLIAVTVATVFTIVAALYREGLFARVLGAAPMRWVGERSYGIYLWHLPIIAFLPRQWLPGVTENVALAWVTSLSVIGGSVALAAVSWRILEDPIRRHGIVEPMLTRYRARKENLDPAPRPYMGAFPATCTVTMVALVSIGLPTLLSGTAATSAAPGGAAVMQLPDDAAEQARANAARPARKADAQMRCTTVIHVGDSTSIGLFNSYDVPEGASTGYQTYLDRGATQVTESVFGARATTQGFQNYPAAVDSVAELLAQGQDPQTCWVIATGVNDAANYAALPDYGYQQNPEEIKTNIRTMLDLLKGQMVMWNTVATYQPADAYYANSNMELFNTLLREVARDYPNVAIWDWAAEVADHPEWFIPGDGTHYLPQGNAERAQRFASALAHAFPDTGSGTAPAEKVVSSQ